MCNFRQFRIKNSTLHISFYQFFGQIADILKVTRKMRRVLFGAQSGSCSSLVGVFSKLV